MHTSKRAITTFSLAIFLFFNSPTLIASLESSSRANPRSPSPELIPLPFLRDTSALRLTSLRLIYSKRGIPVGISSSSSAAGRAGRAGAEDTTTGSGTSTGSDDTAGMGESDPADEPIGAPEPESPDFPDFGSDNGGGSSATDYPTMATGGFFTDTPPTYTPIVPSWPSSTTGSPNAMATSAAEGRLMRKWVGDGCTIFGFLVAAS
ncbi:MAG: hypothetical protein Q9214_005742 [Letrouitia sp. 1 TL-2023]